MKVFGKPLRVAACISAAVMLSGCLQLGAIAGADTSAPAASTRKADTSSYIFCDDFESASSWEGRGGASAELSQSNSYAGNGALYVSERSESWNGAQKALDSSDFSAGKSYSFSACVMPAGSSSTDQFYLSLQYTDSGDETQYVHIDMKTIAKNSYAQLCNSEFLIPADATDVYLYIETVKGTSSFYVDEVIAAPAGTVIEGPKGLELHLGDVNGDGVINAVDSSLGKRCLDGTYANDIAKSAADADQSNVADAEDLRLIQSFIHAQITEFPLGEKVIITPEFEYDANLQFREMPGNYRNTCSERGTVVRENYTSSNDGRGTSANVYLPYGYDSNDTSKKYNVFYLMHGGSENQDTIFGPDAELDNILDHMIMNGELEPLIVVTPTFDHGGVEIFYQELVKDLIPLVEGKYNTYAESTTTDGIKASRMHRAFGGFSMGGVTTWHCFLNILDYVAYYMPLSGDCWVGNSAEEKAANCANAAKNSGYSTHEYFVFCATGREDMAYPNVAPQIDAMKRYTDQFIYTSDLSQGNFYFLVWNSGVHWWQNVVNYIYDVLPYFFHE